jgi:hypothetical protein
MRVKNLRLQDIVARTARVNLRDTVRVLRALGMVGYVLGERNLVARLNTLLTESARIGTFPAPLHSKPDALAITACDDAFDLVWDEYGDDILDSLFELSADPYFDNKVDHRTEGV